MSSYGPLSLLDGVVILSTSPQSLSSLKSRGWFRSCLIGFHCQTLPGRSGTPGSCSFAFDLGLIPGGLLVCPCRSAKAALISLAAIILWC